MVLNLTPGELRAWAARCEAEAKNPANAGRREQLLKMRDALLGLAETEDRLGAASGGPEHPLTEMNGRDFDGQGVDGHDLGALPRPLAPEEPGPSSEQCAAFADQCRRLAETAGSEPYRMALLDMASKWDELSLTRKP
jgi:hypothetical protein